MTGTAWVWADDVQDPFEADRREPLSDYGSRFDSRVLRITMLGGFSIALGSATVDSSSWRRRKAAQIIKLLAAQPERRLHREQLFDFLWPDLNHKAAANNYRVSLHSARQVLASQLGVTDLITVRGELIELASEDMIRIDVRDFEASARAAFQSRNPALFRHAISLYSGEFLPEDRYEDWSHSIRRRLTDTYLELVARLGSLLLENGGFDESLALLREALGIDPLREQTHVELMRLYALTGNRRDAVRQFGELCVALRRDLDAEPHPETRDLYERILAHKFPGGSDVSSAALDLHSVRKSRAVNREAPRHNLPASLNSFIGRGAERADLTCAVSNARLVTVIGAGGSGKTRLAVAVAEQLVDDFADGVWLVDLCQIDDPDLAIGTVAATLGVREEPRDSLPDRLIQNLQGRQLLLLMDNCEHLAPRVAELVHWLLQRCPDLRVLATSREALRVGGEHIWRIPPMKLPDPRSAPAPGDLEHTETLALFLDRARERDATFSPDHAELDQIAGICRRLEGMPLAIELAAAWTAILPVSEIAHRLDSTLSFLTTGPRTAPRRQQTLRATVDWSYRLLNGVQQSLFRRASIFVGGFTLQAAEAVCAGNGLRRDDVLDLLSQLVEKSLLTVDKRGNVVRYRMLETVRQYAEWRLTESCDLDATWARYRDWLVALGEQAELGLVATETREWMQLLRPEIGNIRAFLHWSTKRGDLTSALRLAAALWDYWHLSGRMSEGRGWLEPFLEDPGIGKVPELVRARALYAAGFLAQRQGDYRQAVRWTEDCLARARAIGDTWGVNYALNNLCLCALYQGDIERTIALANESLKLSKLTGIKPVVPTSLSSLGLAEYWRGEMDAAGEYLREAIAAAREIGFHAFASWLLAQLADVERARGRPEVASNYAKQSISLGHKVGDEYGPALGQRALGRLAMANGQFERASSLICESLHAFEQLGYKLRVVECLEDLAELGVMLPNPADAIGLLGAAERVREREACPPPLFRRRELGELVDLSRAELGAEAVDALLEQGRELTLESAVQEAVETIEKRFTGAAL